MDLQLAGKIGLVTGASKGIGLEAVRVLQQEGVTVVTASRTVTPELAATGAVTLTGDLSDPDVPARIVADALGVSGTLDILVNNVGGGDGTPVGAGFLDLTDGL